MIFTSRLLFIVLFVTLTLWSTIPVFIFLQAFYLTICRSFLHLKPFITPLCLLTARKAWHLETKAPRNAHFLVAACFPHPPFSVSSRTLLEHASPPLTTHYYYLWCLRCDERGKEIGGRSSVCFSPRPPLDVFLGEFFFFFFYAGERNVLIASSGDFYK